MVAIGLTIAFVSINMIANYLQLRYQRQEIQIPRRHRRPRPEPDQRRLEAAHRRRREPRLQGVGARVRPAAQDQLHRRQHPERRRRLRRLLPGPVVDRHLHGDDVGAGEGRRERRAGAVGRRVHRLQLGLRPVPRRHAGARRRLAQPAAHHPDLRAHHPDPRHAARSRSLEGLPRPAVRRDRASRTSPSATRRTGRRSSATCRSRSSPASSSPSSARRAAASRR